MVITSYGRSCFKISSGDTVLAFDPPSKKSQLKSPYFETHVVCISHDHDDHNGRDVLHGKGEERPFIIDGPGEYEYKGIMVMGIRSFHDNQNGKKEGINTAYRAHLEDITLLHLGDYGEYELNEELKKNTEDIDVLFLPIGGDSVIDVERAVKIANTIEPRVIIPMHYDASSKKKKEILKTFLDEMGVKDTKPDTKFTFKKKDLPQDETRVVVLEAVI